MKKLTEKNIETLRTYFTGKKLEKFNMSVEMVQESIEKDGWIKYASRKVPSILTQGIGDTYSTSNRSILDNAISRGTEITKEQFDFHIESYRENQTKIYNKKATDDVINSWIRFTCELRVAIRYLNESRPLPVLTEFNLSQRVTTTFKEMGLDIEFSTMKLCPLERKERKCKKKVRRNVGTYMEPEFKSVDVEYLDVYYVCKWPEGTLHGRSRFCSRLGCQACGKAIPSGNFTPFYAYDNALGSFVSFWVGVSCTQNIFGIRDVGIKKN